jgi:hypothetical protein
MPQLTDKCTVFRLNRCLAPNILTASAYCAIKAAPGAETLLGRGDAPDGTSRTVALIRPVLVNPATVTKRFYKGLIARGSDQPLTIFWSQASNKIGASS